MIHTKTIYNHQALLSRFLGFQAMGALGLSVLWSLFSGKGAFYAALWGGACSLLPTGVSMGVMFRNSGARRARQIVNDFYKGEALKLFTTVILIAVALGVYQVSGMPFLLTYIGTVLTIWFLPIAIK